MDKCFSMSARRGSKKEEVNNWIHSFEVTQPTRHKKYFTVYKVISKVFPKDIPAGVTTITVWKRFNDFRKLYKDLHLIHRQLHLRGEFPKFPKGQLFGRFENETIEERRQASYQLLQFAALHPHLYTSKVFIKFFETSYSIDDLVNPVPSSTATLTQEDYTEKPCLQPERLWNPDIVQQRQEEGENLSSTSSFESLTLEGLSSPVIPSSSGSHQTGNTVNPKDNNEVSLGEESIIPSSSNLWNGKLADPSLPVPKSAEHSSQAQELDNRPESGISSSASCSSLDTQIMSDKEPALVDKHDTYKAHSSSGLFEFLPIFPTKFKEKSEKLFSDSLSSSYICEAAGFFAVAQQYESSGDYRHAFSSYKEGIRILLEGAQGDDNPGRKSLARSKLEKYIARAESLHNSYSRKDLAEPDMNLSSPVSSPIKKKEMVLSLGKVPAKSKGGCGEASPLEDLKEYKVVRVIQRKIHVVVSIKSGAGPKCCVIKVVPKSCEPTIDSKKSIILSHKIPFIVSLLKWFETENSYILLLEYASGGRLCDFVNDYQTKQIVIPKFEEESSQYITEEDAERMNEKSRTLAVIEALKELGSNYSRNNSTENENANQPVVPAEKNTNEVRGLASQPNEISFEQEEIPKDIDIQELIENSRFLLKTVNQTLGGVDGNDTLAIEKLESVEAENGTVNQPAYNFYTTSQEHEEPADGSQTSLIENRSTKNKSAGVIRKPLTVLIDVDDQPRSSKYQSELHNKHGSLKVLLESPKLKISKSSTDLNEFASPSHSIESEVPSLKRMIPECCIKVWAAEIIMGLEKLHELGLSFHELDMKNVLLGENGHILLSFKTHWFQADENHIPERNEYSAPEIRNMFGNPLIKAHPSADFWSLGAILFELLIGQSVHSYHPEGFHAQTVIRIPEVNLAGDTVSLNVRSFLSELLQFDPTVRLGYYGAAELKSHPLFEDFDWDGAMEAAAN